MSGHVLKGLSYLGSYKTSTHKPTPPPRGLLLEHISICLRRIVSTTSLGLRRIVPTFHEDTRNLHILHIRCGRWMTVWKGLHLTFSLPGTTLSLSDMALLYDIKLFDILNDLLKAESFTVRCPS